MLLKVLFLWSGDRSLRKKASLVRPRPQWSKSTFGTKYSIKHQCV